MLNVLYLIIDEKRFHQLAMQRTIHSDKWFAASDFTEEGRPLIIDKVEPTEIAPNVLKSVVYFKGEDKGLVLNEVNTRTVVHNTKIPAERWEQWHGYQITPYAASILVKDEVTPCIRIKILVDEVAFKDE